MGDRQDELVDEPRRDGRPGRRRGRGRAQGRRTCAAAPPRSSTRCSAPGAARVGVERARRRTRPRSTALQALLRAGRARRRGRADVPRGPAGGLRLARASGGTADGPETCATRCGARVAETAAPLSRTEVRWPAHAARGHARLGRRHARRHGRQHRARSRSARTWTPRWPSCSGSPTATCLPGVADPGRRRPRRPAAAGAGSTSSASRGSRSAALLCAVAQSPLQLIGARVLQGVAAALLTPGSLAIIESSFRARTAPVRSARGPGSPASPPRSGRSSAASSSSTAAGGWIFLINLPLCLAVLVLCRWRAGVAATGGARAPSTCAARSSCVVGLGAIDLRAHRRQVQRPDRLRGWPRPWASPAMVGFVLVERHPGAMVPTDAVRVADLHGGQPDDVPGVRRARRRCSSCSCSSSR